MRFILHWLSITLLLHFSIPLTVAADAGAPVINTDQETSYARLEDITVRLERIEKTLSNKGLLDLFESIESLRLDLNTLRGEVEVQNHTLLQMRKQQRDLYRDVDQRLQKITSSEQKTATGNNGLPGHSKTVLAEPVTGTDADINMPATDTKEDELSYQRAFKLLKESRYEQALTALKQFIVTYPDSTYADNAQYWIAESNYVMQRYALAINEYQVLMNTYPDSEKSSHALLKIGYSYAELGNNVEAEKVLEQVKRQYPDTNLALLADKRLTALIVNNANF